MLHQIPKYKAHRLAAKGAAEKLAVVVIDGLAMDQWAVVRQEMPHRKWVTEEFGAFAWVPTLTSVSRQSIFADDPPFFLGRASTRRVRKSSTGPASGKIVVSGKATPSMPVRAPWKTTTASSAEGSSQRSVQFWSVSMANKSSIVSDLHGWRTPSVSGEELQAPGKSGPQ